VPARELGVPFAGTPSRLNAIKAEAETLRDHEVVGQTTERRAKAGTLPTARWLASTALDRAAVPRIRYALAMKIKREPTKLEKRARRGHRGYPVATVAFYGPDASRASKVAVGIVPTDNEPVAELRRWWSESGDVRTDNAVGEEILRFIQAHGVRTVAMSPGIIGCPHEERTDYPEGEVCPQCPYWAKRNRWTGEMLPDQ
jgi:hypothetical protein